MAVKKNGIVVVGSVFVDIKGFPHDRYIPDGRNAGYIEYRHGGVSRNVAEDIANIGLNPSFLGLVDHSALGQDVIERLKRQHVNTEYMEAVPSGMGTWLAVFDNNGDVAGSISQRPDLMPILDILNQRGDEIFQEADAILVEIDIEEEILKKIAELCKKYRKKLYGVVSNMTIAAERWNYLSSFDCFICNLLESGILFGQDYSDKTPAQMCDIVERQIHKAEIPSLVVTMGEEGAVYADCEGHKGVCRAMKVDVKDTTGAGDSFCAGVASGLTYGKSLQDSVEIGTRLAASAIASYENVCPEIDPEEFGLS